jgi:hypothetical protein
LPDLAWSADGGEIDDKGGFKVEATAGGMRGQATVTIIKKETPPPQQPPKPEPKTMRWTGAVPPQKWMNFYTKVLAKFATGSSLKLNVSFEIKPDGGLPAHCVDQTKATLRELGLDDDLRIDE